MATLAANLKRLRSSRERLPRDLRDAVLADPSSYVPELVRLLVDRERANAATAGGGQGPIHAVELLAELRAPEGLAPMVDVLLTTGWSTSIHDHIVSHLPKYGERALEPVLAALATAEGEAREDLLLVLAKLKTGDPRVLPILLEMLGRDLSLAAICLADHGDRAALPALEEAMAGWTPDVSTLYGRMELAAVVDAHAGLGGTLEGPLGERVGGWLRASAEARDAASAASQRGGSGGGSSAPVRVGPKVGRNDPCPCGSGKKHKKCCLGA